jgi:hypothetical protein
MNFMKSIAGSSLALMLTFSAPVAWGGAHFVVGIERRQHSQLSGPLAWVNSLSDTSELSIAGA